MASEVIERDVTPEKASSSIELPASTAWPFILAFGATLLVAGLVTSPSISILGAILAVTGCVGWFRELLPVERHEPVAVESIEPVRTITEIVDRRPRLVNAPHRARLPIEIYPISAGIRGGLVGSVAMAIPAVLYGIISQHSIWYPINLLSAGFFPARNTTAALAAFHWDGLLVAAAVHLLVSLLVGLLYGAMLPMVPRHPILLGGLIAPLVWSGLLYEFLDFIDPVLNQRVNWLWFVVSQIAFGVVAGIVVARQHRVRTWQYLPFVVRAGFEIGGATHTTDTTDTEDGEQHLP